MTTHTVAALIACHNENPYLKFVGKCNPIKKAMMECFAKDTDIRRKISAARAQKVKARLASKIETP